jgi:hypothetical protein
LPRTRPRGFRCSVTLVRNVFHNRWCNSGKKIGRLRNSPPQRFQLC